MGAFGLRGVRLQDFGPRWGGVDCRVSDGRPTYASLPLGTPRLQNSLVQIGFKAKLTELLLNVSFYYHFDRKYWVFAQMSENVSKYGFFAWFPWSSCYKKFRKFVSKNCNINGRFRFHKIPQTLKTTRKCPMILRVQNCCCGIPDPLHGFEIQKKNARVCGFGQWLLATSSATACIASRNQ